MESSLHTISPVHTDKEYEVVFSLREKVLQEEFNVPEEFDVDGNDHIAHHYLAYHEGMPVGTARWRVTLGRKVKLERFAVLPEHRGAGLGRKLLEAVLRDAPQGFEIYLEAHGDVVPFYEKHGFIADGPSYDVSDIPHQRMIYPR